MKKWVRSGLVWGVSFYLITIIIIPLMNNEDLSSYKLLVGIPLWIITGLAVGYLFDKKKKKVIK
ncbi:hypothetical protein GCM10007424_14200 [Flavobacterium suaedae]|uniref:Group-specific protein n=1 Tax=Flavobacterium suaedae TaxID=1767027 RepID=A0ABQ1JU83_9FLAO|nr:hypothetical protein [Flavobacterium suaedae]GGB75426.1 hypothetical protein GCM10007424_14200 [Flavobacterium suaedae]